MNGEPYSRTRRHQTGHLGHEHGNATLAAIGGVAVGVIVVLLIWLVVLMTNKDDPVRDAATTPQQPTTAAPAPVTTLTVAPSAKATTSSVPAPPKVVGDVRSLPAGLFCRDLKAKGFSYVAAIDYWRLHGQPNQMDADRNGIPCETVYPRSDVGAYWNGREIGGAAPLGSGLLCRDLAARGATYAQAVAYWWYYDMPQRMDADKNGIPCETVYSAATVNAFWYS
ncbi:hypothetical protein E0H73_38055 [Kribbella pittospori]|uniref:Excalibur calcium-binding domain-containing protein n=1 Tax=Kribbella pittospori TaxID=722689 RepID=A0A4R0K3I6_9ACTN|nr:excalibur calcium-binding domain-containing protein [Kribbella pittospori]TCC54571.1 hypothetical protein E0H73_38055 [Kribbella pittospori]